MKYVFLVVILILILIFFRIKKQIKDINYLNDILYTKKEPEKYIEAMDKILAIKQTDKNKIINSIQKTTGMLYAGRFDELIEILKNIDIAPKNWLPIYYQNLLLALFFNKNKNKANEEFRKAKPIFEEFSKNQYYKEFIDIVYSVSDFYNGKGSKKYFTELAEAGANDYRKSFGYYFLGMINKNENNLEEASKNFKYAMEYGKGSFIEKLSMQ
jgi:tetratricopeptide (TPR) repeat protein